MIRFTFEASAEALYNNLKAYLVCSEILRGQSQPLAVKESERGGLIFSVRANLAQDQCEQLVVKPIRANLPCHEVALDWGKKELSIHNADKASTTQPVKPSRQKPNRGRVNPHEI